MNDINFDLKTADNKNLGQVFKSYSKYWLLITISVITCLALVFLYLRYKAVNQYEINSTIFLKNTSAGKNSGDIENFRDLGLIKTSQSLEDEIGIITSSGIMEEVITDNFFNINFYHKGSVKDVEIYGEDVPVQILVDENAEIVPYGLFIDLNFIDDTTYELSTEYEKKEISSTHAYGETVTTDYGTLTVLKKPEVRSIEDFNTLRFVLLDTEELVNLFLKNLSVYPDNDTGSLLRMTFVSSHKRKGEDILSKLIDTYIKRTIKYENELAENTIQIIDNRLKLLSGEIENVEKSVVDFKTKNVVTDVASNADTYIQQANDYKEKASNYQSQINILSQIEQTLLNGTIENSIGGGFAINDRTLTDQVNRYNETLLERQNLSQSAVTSNPMIVKLDANLSNLRQSILQNVQSSKNGLALAKRNLQDNANKYDAQLARVPGMEKQLLDISRDKSTKEGLYLYLLQKREEEVLSLAAPASSTRVVNRPKSGIYPISPNKKLTYLAGLLLGLFLPISTIYFKNAFNTKITSIEEINNLTVTPVVGEISKHTGSNLIVAKQEEQEKQSHTLELFRLLRFNLEYLKKDQKNQTILITSSIKGEGKTFIASNLALSLASIGEKVALLSFDLRKPSLMSCFNLDEKIGVTDFIIKKGINKDSLFQNYNGIENLKLMGSGIVIGQISTIVLHERVGELINELKTEFDRIIIDTAPIGLVSDAFALNPFIDSTIYVVRKDFTKKEHIGIIDNIYKNNKLNNCMILFNDTEPKETYN
ncbi:capsular exopolysaccharide synthesis family protein [Maribacter spongiicola]|uniref:Capsular exopolysaccharide synthesis family protein n=1 Tax=Maribacter spongiicola TaxID=1206753 RepID=A0A4R7K654_9FLAO|nr:polysaccharide biosynthesis tyrosine autokinase [Maribacter spongiicola]TDT46737.1 capsular exopolysaccharide synthesis family protein [Maribacter spongiicola]